MSAFNIDAVRITSHSQVYARFLVPQNMKSSQQIKPFWSAEKIPASHLQMVNCL